MTLYEKLDIIADSYNPALLVISILIIFSNLKSKGKTFAFYKLGLLVSLITLVYIFQIIDNHFNIWVAFGLDYSTHTAFAAAIIFFILFDSIKIKTPIIISFVCYLALMLYQEYHTVADILTTIAAISPLMYAVAYYVNLRLTKRSH